MEGPFRPPECPAQALKGHCKRGFFSTRFADALRGDLRAPPLSDFRCSVPGMLMGIGLLLVLCGVVGFVVVFQGQAHDNDPTGGVVTSVVLLLVGGLLAGSGWIVEKVTCGEGRAEVPSLAGMRFSEVEEVMQEVGFNRVAVEPEGQILAAGEYQQVIDTDPPAGERRCLGDVVTVRLETVRMW